MPQSYVKNRILQFEVEKYAMEKLDKKTSDYKTDDEMKKDK